MIKCINPTDNDWYPSYHLAPYKGWLSDPNGLIYHDGYYHVYYQHNPNLPLSSMQMKWGHAISKNMVDWEHLPPALTPSIDDDIEGCFSGCTVNDNGILYAVYTGNSKDHVQAQCLASSKDNGKTFVKEGLVLPSPEGIRDIRDPKVWRQNNKWYMILALKTEAAQIDVYTSDDLREWQFNSTLLKSGNLFFPFLFSLIIF